MGRSLAQRSTDEVTSQIRSDPSIHDEVVVLNGRERSKKNHAPKLARWIVIVSGHEFVLLQV